MDTLEKTFEGDGEIYFYRNTLIRSREGRNVDILVITSQRKRMPFRENPISGLFPDDPLNNPFTYKIFFKIVISFLP